MALRRILPALLARLTKTGRYLPEIEWSDKSWTHNVFRAYELIFWRRYGIRAEARSTSDGHYEVYTFEAFCALIETQLRKVLKWHPIEVRQPQLAGNPYGYWFPQIRFAIALDVANELGTAGGTGTTPASWSHTVTGSNPFLFLGTHTSSSNTTLCTVGSATYNSVSMTKAKSNSSITTFATESGIWFLGAPATGAHTVSFAFSGGVNGTVYGGAVSYSGAQSSSVADASNGTNGTGTGVKSTSVTTIADNCWVVSVMTNAGSSGTVTPGNTVRWRQDTAAGTAAPINQAVVGGSDTNAAKTPAGAQSMSWTVGAVGTNFSLSAASFAPVATATFIATANKPILQAVNRAGGY